MRTSFLRYIIDAEGYYLYLTSGASSSTETRFELRSNWRKIGASSKSSSTTTGVQYKKKYVSLNALVVSYILSQRYLVSRDMVPKCSIMQKISLLRVLDEGRVRQEIRMDLSSFDALYLKIMSHSVYNPQNGTPQIPLKVQMIVALERLGYYGNGASIGKFARAGRISERAVVCFTKRFIIAVISNLAKEYLRWPTAEERKIINKEIEEEYGFPECVGFVDGSLFPLSNRPTWSTPQNFRNDLLKIDRNRYDCGQKLAISHFWR
ncbi:uncharacterized protein EV154DRAFT_578454 [Mucor mucedo]|uniref:uncharacterized protein n=1 Tax=Mucor mucedo TaxID=29922 RepID=UPI0022207BE7|nr:uncharacterized protein EV154DRAFT_578454 [Mucor mucedo]KAI7874185.1 hypothetical protein EV154DRAFT_578454 [Mucor mucedo]